MGPRDGIVRFLLRAMIGALALGLVTRWVDGVTADGPTTLIVAGLLLGLVNAFVRPIAILLTLPFTFLTLGLFLLVVNAAMLGLVAALIPGLRIAGFGPAFFGAMIISIVSWIGSWIIGPRGRIKIEVHRP